MYAYKVLIQHVNSGGPHTVQTIPCRNLEAARFELADEVRGYRNARRLGAKRCYVVRDGERTLRHDDPHRFQAAEFDAYPGCYWLLSIVEAGSAVSHPLAEMARDLAVLS